MIELRNEPFIIELITQGCEVYLVGGYVRDAQMNLPSKDLDILVENINILPLVKILSKYGDADLVGESFGVIKFQPNICVNPELKTFGTLDIAIPRVEVKTGNEHKAFEVIASKDIKLEQDLNRRDFTMNAMALTLEGFLIDPFNGLTAIASKCLHYVNPKAFIEDPLRILRGIRFAARFNFDISSNLNKLMVKNIKQLTYLSKERIEDEFEKGFATALIKSHYADLLEYYNIREICLNIKDELKPIENSNMYADFIFQLYNRNDQVMDYAHYISKKGSIFYDLSSLKVLERCLTISKELQVLEVAKALDLSKIVFETKIFPELDEIILNFKLNRLPQDRTYLNIDAVWIIEHIQKYEQIPSFRITETFNHLLKMVLLGNISNIKEELEYTTIQWIDSKYKR